MSSWLWSSSPFDEAVDKATSELLPTDGEDIVLNLEICDQIKAKSVPPQTAMRALKRRLNHKNPNVQLLALSLTDVCVKNGGNHFLAEIAGREFMDNLVSILKMPALNMDVKNRILRYIQNWAIALEGKPQFLYINTVYKTLQKEGFVFPPKDLALAADAMTDTAIAPEWIDSDVCLRCRDPFTVLNRKHHCRNCGLIFDHKCSSKTLPLPHFGITQEVRVCDSCHFKLTKKKEAEAAAKEAADAKKRAERAAKAMDNIDPDLQKAIQLSLQESQVRPGYTASTSTNRWQVSEPPLIDRTTRPEDDEDEQVRLAIEESLRLAQAPRPSAPVVEEVPTPSTFVPAMAPALATYNLNPQESDAILTFNQTVTQAQAMGGLHDPRRAHELSDRAETYRPKLARSLDDAGRKEQLLSEMHTKLSQAVQLYDHLLNEQLSHRTYQTPNAVAPYQAQPLGTPNQWVPQRTASPAKYNPSTSTAHMSGVQPVSQQQQQWALARPATTQTPVYHSPPTAVTQYQQTQQTYSTLPPVTMQTYQPPQQPAAPPPPVTSPPASVPSATSSQTPGLSRHASLAHRPASVAYQTHHQPGLHRSATISSTRAAPTSAQPSYTHATLTSVQPAQPLYTSQQQQSQLPQPQPPVVPHFPTAPTNAPATFSLYDTNVPTQQPVRDEPKEALLIEL